MPGRPTIWILVGQGPTALAGGAGGGCLDIFSLVYHFFFLTPSLWETARYRLKYCLKGPLSPNQPTNQPTCSVSVNVMIGLIYCLSCYGYLGDHQHGKWLFMWLSLIILGGNQFCIVFSHNLSWVGSGIELCTVLRIFLLNLQNQG